MDDKMKEKIDEYIKILEAFRNGETIQWAEKIYLSDIRTWDDVPVDYISWDFNCLEYRIKPKDVYRPYKNIAEFIPDLMKHCGFVKCYTGDIYSVKQIINGASRDLGKDIIELSGFTLTIDFEMLLKNFVWVDDNSKCGIKEE